MLKKFIPVLLVGLILAACAAPANPTFISTSYKTDVPVAQSPQSNSTLDPPVSTAAPEEVTTITPGALGAFEPVTSAAPTVQAEGTDTGCRPCKGCRPCWIPTAQPMYLVPQPEATALRVELPPDVSATSMPGQADGQGEAAQANWQLYTTANAVNDLSLAPDGALWAATDGGVVRWEVSSPAADTPYVKYSYDNGLPLSPVTQVLAARDGMVWAGSKHGQIARFDGKQWQLFSLPELSWSMDIQEIVQDRQGRIWFATFGAGVLLFDGHSWTVFLQKDGLPSVAVSNLAEDGQGNIWAAAYIVQCDCLDTKNAQGRIEAGLARFDGQRWHRMDQELEIKPDDTGSSVVWSLATAPQGLWLIGADNLQPGYFDGKQLKRSAEVSSVPIQHLKVSSDGKVWGFNGSGEVYAYQDQGWQLWAHIDDLPDRLTDVEIASNGSIWLATKQGIAGLSEKQATDTLLATGAKDALPAEQISDGASTLNGALWLATGNGAVFFNGQTWRTFTQKDGLPSNDVRNVVVATDGTVWIDTLHSIDETISSYDGKTWTVHRDYGDFQVFMGFEPDGGFWAWSYDEDVLKHHDRMGWQSYEVKSIQVSFPVNVVQTRDGYIYLDNPTSDGPDDPRGIFRYDGKGWVYIYNDDCAPESGIQKAPDGSLWVENRDGFFRMEDGVWALQSRLTYLSNWVFDAQGAIWGAEQAEDGWALWRVQDNQWTHIQVPYPVLSVRSIFTAPDGIIWIVTDAGLLRYQGNIR